MQRGYPVGHQHAKRQQTNRHRPEDAQPAGGVAVDIFKLRGEIPQHQRPGVRRGHIKQQASNGGDGGAKGKRRILRQQAVEAALRMDHRFLGKCRAAVDDFIQRAIAEHREP
ncbi:hypothetical protein ExPUPEC61_04482 [Escherichia coli]|nr:hypothetical protein ExPUPEC61_04482 [Escherichia coli]